MACPPPVPQRWDAQKPQAHGYTWYATPAFGNENYCRNTYGNMAKPWCYTTDPKKRWEACAFDVCPDPPPTKPPKECVEADNPASYRGKVT